MTPRQQAEQLEVQIKNLGFQLGHRETELFGSYLVDKIIQEYEEVNLTARINTSGPIRYWKEVKTELRELLK